MDTFDAVAVQIDPRYSSTISKLFSSALFRDLAEPSGEDRVRYIRDVYKKAYGLKTPLTLRDFFRTSYQHLRRYYPSEYVYKNEAIKQVVLSNHKLSETGLFTEFPCHGSKADLLAVNGTTTVYEIKTELDNLNRLEQQLDDYCKAFARVNVITCESNAGYISRMLNGSPFGLLVYEAGTNRFEIIKEAKDDLGRLDSARMFSLMRMAEYREVVYSEFGQVPDVINTRIYAECFALFETLSKRRQRDWVTQMLHRRQIARHQIAFSSKLPASLKALGMTRPFTPMQCATIEDSLSISL